ncbi:MAG TPA: MerR family transcriptional regulator [Chitinophagales bacterium]|nr:MerR family transcriptional regulator [Chitinophagales bacterium]
MKLQYEESFPEKQYYAIGEVAKMLNTTVSKIRFWEIEFDVLRPKKNKKGDRFFTKQDIEYLRLIYHLLKEKGYTIEGARKQLQQNPEKQFEKMKLIKSLKEIREFLSSLKNQLDKNSA